MKTIIIKTETKDKYDKKRKFLLFAIACSAILFIFNRPEDKTKMYSGTWQVQDVRHKNRVINLSATKMEIEGKVKKIQNYCSGTSADGEAIGKTSRNTQDIINNLDKYMYKTILRSKGEIFYYTFVLKKEKKVYTIVFPSKDKNKAIMIDSKSIDYSLQGTVLYAMNRKTKPDYDDYMNRYIKSDITKKPSNKETNPQGVSILNRTQ